MNIKEFIKKFCSNCKESCNKGIVEKNEFIRCIDRDVYVKKNIEKKQ